MKISVDRLRINIQHVELKSETRFRLLHPHAPHPHTQLASDDDDAYDCTGDGTEQIRIPIRMMIWRYIECPTCVVDSSVEFLAHRFLVVDAPKIV